MITLSTGRLIDPMLPITLLGLSNEEYRELIEKCKERNNQVTVYKQEISA